MGNILNRDYEKYLVYPNESIDKLTVNRTFERLFEDIDLKMRGMSLVLSGATEKSYGKAKFSSLDGFRFETPSIDDELPEYNGSMLTIGQLKDMSDRIVDTTYNAVYTSPLSSNGGGDVLPIDENAYWVRSKYMDSKFMFMPNGVNMVSCSFEIGFNGIANMLSDDSVSTADVISPVTVSSYSNMISVDQESVFNIEDYMTDAASNRGENPYWEQIDNIENMDGRRMEIPFITDAKVTLRHNDCEFTKFSSYRQSYIEMCMSVKISLRYLYETKYGFRKYEIEDENSEITESRDENVGEASREFRFFTQRPMVMAQIGFYNNDSVPKPLFGFDNVLSGGDVSEFSSHNRLSQKPLDETTVDDMNISPVNGSVFVKKVENEYDHDGNIVDNFIHLDIVMKFMAGSASDPELEYAMNTFNSRSKVQFVMIGV